MRRNGENLTWYSGSAGNIGLEKCVQCLKTFGS